MRVPRMNIECGCVLDLNDGTIQGYCDVHDPLKEQREAIARGLAGISRDIRELAFGNALIQAARL